MIQLEFSPVHEGNQQEAKDLILEGFKERFGFIDSSLNPDLNDVIRTYRQDGYLFLTALFEGELIATGAVIYEEEGVGRIQRMSVKNTCRRQGVAKAMLGKLEEAARQFGYKTLVLETNHKWNNAIRLYTSYHYQLVADDGQRCHFEKKIEKRGSV